MDQKTVISNSRNNSSNVGDFYGRSESNPNIKRTYIQGMKPREENKSTNESVADERQVRIKLQNRPIAGVLYSVSRDVCGEMFPVYVGRNTIGSDPQSDIYLSEETVSPNHAVLLIRQICNEDGERQVTMNITDYDSEYGTAVNGQALGYDRQTLKGNEIIQIGNSYYFLFVALDAAPYGLGQVPGFAPIPRQDSEPAPFQPINEIYMPVRNEPIYPSVVGQEDERTFYGRTYAKKEDHSAKKTIGN